MSALLLSRQQVRDLLSPADCLDAVERAFRASRIGTAYAPAPLHLSVPDGGFHAKGALLERDGRTYAAVKLNGNFPGNPERFGRPTIQGIIILSGARDGAVLAIMDSIEITLLRTAAASALAARYLARPDASVICVTGCGDQAPAQLAALAQVRTIKRGYCHDVNATKAAAFAERIGKEHNIPLEPVADLASAARRSDIIVTCTTARSPILDKADVAPGGFIAAVGADNPEKSEIAPNLMEKARVVADSLDQCAVMGDLHHAIAAGALSKGDVHAELADILIGARPGRTSDAEIFIFDSTGTALQDVACAALAYERARSAGVSKFQFN